MKNNDEHLALGALALSGPKIYKLKTASYGIAMIVADILIAPGALSTENAKPEKNHSETPKQATDSLELAA